MDLENRLVLPKVLIILFLLIFSSVNLFSQVVSDNVFAFGFENVFDWNISVVNKKQADDYIRMIMFEDEKTVNTKIIMFALTKLKEDGFSSHIESLGNISILEELPNPYTDSTILIFSRAEDKDWIYSTIEHFGYCLNVGYLDEDKIELEKFVKLIKTYQNIKIEL